MDQISSLYISQVRPDIKFNSRGLQAIRWLDIRYPAWYLVWTRYPALYVPQVRPDIKFNSRPTGYLSPIFRYHARYSVWTRFPALYMSDVLPAYMLSNPGYPVSCKIFGLDRISRYLYFPYIAGYQIQKPAFIISNPGYQVSCKIFGKDQISSSWYVRCAAVYQIQ